MTDSQKIFEPRPEAQATTWDELMPPVQMAVHDLLVRIHGAHLSVRDKNTGKSANSPQKRVNCFLVYGARGTGKTTVLLNAQKAVCRKEGEGFFVKNEEQKKLVDAKYQAEYPPKYQAEKNAEQLWDKNGVVWLNILDLEPIPSEANLLTVLLTQVRNALHSHGDKRQRNQRSVFEEEAESAQQLLNRLIGETTLMWQNITEPDTRNISARQVKAADIYAEFSEKFKKAMNKLIDELSDTRGSDSKVSIVLPIDNIDRSTEHLQSIVKLAQLVSHPNLWLVMAGDRVEVETFLERVYWKELIRGTAGISASGKTDSEGEDETLVMARRQANATAQKLWPENHRVEINFLTPKETLEFAYKQFADNRDNKFTIKDFLQQITIPMTENQRDLSKKENSTMTLFNLFDITEQTKEFQFNDNKDKDKKLELAFVANHGLWLSARNVLELWQLLDWMVTPASSSDKDFRAEKVARTMLRKAISSSLMPNATAKCLQDAILSRNEKGGTVLSFWDFKKPESSFEENSLLHIQSVISPNPAFDFALRPVISKMPKLYRSQLLINNIQDIYTQIKTKITKPSSLSSNQPPEEPELSILPPLPAAWLRVLYDILMLSGSDISSVINYSKNYENYFYVSVTHNLIKGWWSWSIPEWRPFWGHNIFREGWKIFRQGIILLLSKSKQKNQNDITRLLASGWIFCVLKTSFVLVSSIDPKFALQESSDSELQEQVKNFENTLEESEQDFLQIDIDRIETNMMQLVLISSIDSKFALQEFNNTKLREQIKNFENKLTESERSFQKMDIGSIETNIMQTAEQFYQLLQHSKNYQNESDNPIITAAYNVMSDTGNWLENELICFLSYAYVPLPTELSKKRLETMWGALSLPQENAAEQENTAEKKFITLQEYWQENLPFILPEREEKDEKGNIIESPNSIPSADLYEHLRKLNGEWLIKCQ